MESHQQHQRKTRMILKVLNSQTRSLYVAVWNHASTLGSVLELVQIGAFAYSVVDDRPHTRTHHRKPPCDRETFAVLTHF